MIWDFQNVLSMRLLAWAAASLLAGGICWLTADPFWQGVGLPMVFWGLAAALTGWAGRRGLSKKLASPLDLNENAARAGRIRRVLGLSAGGSLLLLAGGAALVLRYGAASALLGGMGWGSLVQAIFLLLFSSLHAWQVPQEIQLPDWHLFDSPVHAPFTIQRGKPAALVVHGFPDTPAAMRPLADALAARGWSVSGMLLPGFGRELPGLYQHRTAEWIDAIQTEVERLKQAHDPVILVGFSMGAGCSIPAAVRSRPAGLVLLAPFWWNETLALKFLYYALRLLGPITIHVGPWARYINLDSLSEGIGEIAPGIYLDDPIVRQAIRDLRVPAAFTEQVRVLGRAVRSSAPLWKGPVLIVQGTGDPVARPANSRRLIQLLGVPPLYHEVPGGHNLNREDHPSFSLVMKALITFADSIYTPLGSNPTPAQESRMTATAFAGLPDIFRFQDGRRLELPAEWPARRQELLRQILDIEYGGFPPAPREMKAEELITHPAARLGNACHSQYRLTFDGAVSFVLDLLVPAGDGPFPTIIDGDTCWAPIPDDIQGAVLARGYILAAFNRAEVAPDVAGRSSAIYQAYPGEYGALSAWAWGYSRCVDFLLTQSAVHPHQICVTGHSRGGKATLLAGAVDERVALTVPNDSGCGGAGSYYRQGEHSETMADITRRFSFWFGPKLAQYVGHESDLPFDQHGLKALIAPRALLTTEALDDLWANPSGTWLSHQAARQVFDWLGQKNQAGIWYRPGGHAHTLEDWRALLDFADWKFRGLAPDRDFDPHPFPDLR